MLGPGRSPDAPRLQRAHEEQSKPMNTCTLVRSGWRVVAILTLAVVAPASHPQDLSEVLPELKTVPAPDSIRAGLRLSYSSSVASVPPSFLTIWPDENGLVTPSASGHGYTQVDVVGLTPQVAGLNVTAWQFHLYTGPLVPVAGGQAGLVCHAGGGDWWVHPQVLAKVRDVSESGLTILRMPQRIGTTTHSVLRIQRETEKARHALSYDLSTGYLVYRASTVQSGDNTLATQMFFAGTRQLALPWAGETLPAWVARGQRLRYEGTQAVTVWGSGRYSLPLSAEVEIVERSGPWCVFDQTVTLGGGGVGPDTINKATLVTGVDHLSGLCLPVAGLLRLEAGQTIDVDPVTEARVEVNWKGRLESGHPGVTFRLSGSVFWSETTFDAVTGAAVALRAHDGSSSLYTAETEVFLVVQPALPPPTPLLEITREPTTGAIALRCPTTGATRVTLWRSTDGGRAWVALPGWEDRPCTGTPVVHVEERPAGAAWFKASLR